MPQVKKQLRQPLFIRFSHWTHVFLMFILLLTGFYIHSPLGNIPFLTMNIARKYHFIAAWFISFLAVIRVYYSAVTGEYRLHTISKEDFKNMPGLLAYYFFLKRKHSSYGKYNPGQKITHALWVLAFGLQVFSGVILYYNRSFNNLLKFSGLMNTWRTLHFAISVFFLITTMLHIYLALTENRQNLKAMFSGVSKKYTVEKGPKK